jgi:arginine/ornithine succinyltransferase subunit-like protein
MTNDINTAGTPGDGLRWRARLVDAGRADDRAALAGLLDVADLMAAERLLATDGQQVWVAQPEGGPLAGLAVAALCVRRHIGHPVPQAWFRLGWAVHASAELGLYRRQRTLLLGHDLTGADELSGFALAPALPGESAGPAWAALLAAVLPGLNADPGPERPPCIALLPGVRDGGGRSPVWQGLGRHFHGQDLDAARRQHGPDWVQHVAPLLPRQVLYASLLPQPAQDALGQAAPEVQPLRQALQAAGFEWRGHVGLADGGPVLERWPRPA